MLDQSGKGKQKTKICSILADDLAPWRFLVLKDQRVKMTVNTERTHTLTSSQFLGCGKNVQESIIACGFGGDLTAPPMFGRRGSCRLDWVPLPQNIQISVACSIILIHSSTQANSGHIQNILLIVTMAITDTNVHLFWMRTQDYSCNYP